MATVQSSRFGELLKQHRAAAGLTQEELAERARLSVQSISTLERGTRHTPHRDTVRRLVEALELQGEEQSRFEAAARRLGSPIGDGRSAEGSPPIGRFLGALPAGPMVARSEELDRIGFAIDAVEGGAGRLVLLTGEAGVGKTRLAQEVMVLTRERGFLVATGRCYEAGMVALYPFREALDGVYAAASPSVQAYVPKRSPYLERLLPEPAARTTPAVADGRGEGPTLEEQYQVFEEITGYLKAVAGERRASPGSDSRASPGSGSRASPGSGSPLAILLDDLQWADRTSLDLVSHLARHTRGDRILLLGTYRDTEVAKEHPLQRMVRDLAREGLVERVPLRRLGLEETAALVGATVSGLEGAEEFVEFVHRRSKGNPFYVEKMVQGLGGHYCLVRQIGAGGMGRVFEAVDTRSGERVAAKVMLARTEADPKGLQRFEQEGAVLAELDHPNIVRVHGTFLEEHASCIVMELVEGQSLGEIVRAAREDGEGTVEAVSRQPSAVSQEGTTSRSGYLGQQGAHNTMSLRRIKGLMEQVVAALECAHGRAIIHRDIKPDNIMVADGDRVKVTDFGIARMLRPVEALTTMTSTGMTIGTPLYMAPEQIQSKKVDARSDIYSLGCVLYELVTGRPPFVGDDPFAVGLQHVLEAPRPPRELNGELPEDWEELILRMLAKDPAERFQTAAALGAAVAALSSEGAEDAVAVPPSGADGEGREKPAETRGMRWWWRWPALGGVAGIILVALAAVLLVRGAGSPGSNHGGFAALKPVAVWSGATLPPVHFQSPDAVALDESHGAMYIADAKRNAIFKLSLSGRPLGQCGCVGSGRLRLNAPGGVAVDARGNVYAADTGNDRIVKFSPKGAWMATWGKTGSGPGQFRHPRGITIDRQGNIIVADTGNDRIQRLSPRGKPLNSWGQTGSGPGQFSSPNGVAVDTQGTIYVADGNNLSIVKLSPRGAPLDRFSTSGDGCHCSGTFDNGGTFAPSSVAVDARGKVYAADAFDGLIRRFTSDGRASTGLNGLSGVVKGALRRRLRFLQGLAVDGRSNIYVADAGAGHVDQFSADGRLLAEWSVGGAATIPFVQPVSVRIGPRGIVYVMDNTNGSTGSYSGSERIFTLSDAGRGLDQWGVPLLATHYMNVAISGRAVDSTGEMFVTDSMGDLVQAYSAGNLQVPVWTVRGFSDPTGIAVHEQRGGESIYVADTLHDRIVKLSRSGRILASFRTYDASGYYDPTSVTVDAQGYLYIADSNVGNSQSAHGPLNRIHKMSPRGVPIVDWRVTGNGVAINGRMLLASDRQGNVYVLQEDFAHVLKVSPSGKLLGQWGTYGSGPGQFANPSSIAVDRQRNVYVADTGNNRIQKFGPLG